MSFRAQDNLSRAAERVRQSPRFVASLFDAWESAFGGSIAAALDAQSNNLDALAVCLRPRDDHWSKDVAEIALACCLDETRLASLLRQALAVEVLASAPPVGDVVDGRLLAARDRGEGEDE